MSTELFMLDTNTVSYALRHRDENLNQRLVDVGMHTLCISVITEAELLYGLARRPAATTLARLVKAFLKRVQIRSWDSAAAHSYARLRVFGEQ